MTTKQIVALTPRNFVELVRPTGNIYEATVIISKRAKQIVVKLKAELDAEFADFPAHTDNLEEVFEHKERIEVSEAYEKQPKPATVATEEFLADKVYVSSP